MTPDDLHLLPEGELKQLAIDVRHEQEIRQIPSVIAALNSNYLEAEGTVPGQDWRQPTGAHDAYPLDWEVLWGGKRWASLVSANVWEPGVSSWREVVPPEDPPAEWVQPTGAQDAYNTGDRVTFQGVIYTSLIDGNVWSPTDHPAGWQADPAV